MKITSVETTIVKLPFTHGGVPTGFGGVNWGTIDLLLVQIRTDSSLSGWGEAFGFNISAATKTVIDGMISPLLINADPAQIDEICLLLHKKLHLFGRNGPVNYGISGINIALWDLAGKVADLPLHALLDPSRPARKIPAYASLLRYGNPGDVASNVQRALNTGYRSLKLHEIELANIQAARDAAGKDVHLMVDTNCAWDLDTAREMATALESNGIRWLEEPIWPPEDRVALASLRESANVSIAAGENVANATEFRQMIEAGAIDFAQPSVVKCGGISEMRKIFDLADNAGISIAPHSPYFGPGFLATLHLIVASGRDMAFERLYVDLEKNLYGDLIHPVDGYLQLPQEPGLGRDPDPEIIARYRDQTSSH